MFRGEAAAIPHASLEREYENLASWDADVGGVRVAARPPPRTGICMAIRCLMVPSRGWGPFVSAALTDR